jgi:hypothetical protein
MQCARALSALATDNSIDKVSNNEASYTIERGSTFLSTPVVLVSSSVSPQTSVASLPAYVVGTARIGRPVRR